MIVEAGGKSSPHSYLQWPSATKPTEAASEQPCPWPAHGFPRLEGRRCPPPPPPPPPWRERERERERGEAEERTRASRNPQASRWAVRCEGLENGLRPILRANWPSRTLAATG
ncbi:hypothetical protein DAI22_02g306866 [Oryza sativa Japonica Group]|nr:hypothetical protein DAI22_02g306866 [Oryza sativa Japonica Group]